MFSKLLLLLLTISIGIFSAESAYNELSNEISNFLFFPT